MIIGGIAISDHAGHEIRQTITEAGGRTMRRTKNGTPIVMQRWVALNSTISGTGWMPDGLDGLDLTQLHDVYCIQSLSVASASNVITIPRNFRIDAGYEPQGATIIDGAPVETAVALAGSVATLTPVAGATQYQILYYPIINGALTLDRNFDERAGEWTWTIDVQGAPGV
ncbi:MAG: hypothetical protein ACU836_16415 [Gammaproteobacteria bacterium]